jgi:Glycosyl hydrolase family 65 central catalytic domain
MMLEIARFWASIARFNPGRERYEIHGVMGPDEFHEKYPDASKGGLRNNACTNVMVAWLCGVAQEVLSLLPATRAGALRGKLGLGEEELRTWADMSRRMFVPVHGDGIIGQFGGYEDLQKLGWDAYRAKYGNIRRLDRILHAAGDDPNRYKVAKRADTVMLFFLFSPGELRGLFERLGYGYGPDTARKNIADYDQGAIFDVDGVLVDSPHEKAWRESLRELMEGKWNHVRGRTTWSPEAFTPQVYQEEMPGKPRMSGARAALEYFHVPDDDDLRLAHYAARKQQMVVRLIQPATPPPTPTRCGSSSPPKTPASGPRRPHRRRTRSCSCARSGSTHSPSSRESRRRRCAQA